MALLLKWALGLILWGCDFTPPVKRTILKTQNLINEGQYSLAVENYQRVLEKNPPKEIQAKINYQMGDLYSIYLARPQKGLKYYEQVISLTKDQRWKKKAFRQLADLSFSHLKNFPKAITYYKKLLDLETDPSKRDFYDYRLALCYFHGFSFGQAEEKFKKIPKKESSYYLAMISFYQQRWSDAVSLLREYLKKERNREETIKATFVLANALESQGNLKEAYRTYHSMLGRYPNTEVVKMKLKAISDRRIAKKRN